MKLLLTLLAFMLVACVDAAPMAPSPTDDDGSATVGHAPVTASLHAPEPDPQPCDSCYSVVATNVWFVATRSDGSPWDADGSPADLHVVLTLNGTVIEQTETVWDSALIYYSSMNMYRADFGQTDATVTMHDGDTLLEQAFDDSGYLAFSCTLHMAPDYLAGASVLCFESVGEFYVSFTPLF